MLDFKGVRNVVHMKSWGLLSRQPLQFPLRVSPPFVNQGCRGAGIGGCTSLFTCFLLATGGLCPLTSVDKKHSHEVSSIS